MMDTRSDPMNFQIPTVQPVVEAEDFSYMETWDFGEIGEVGEEILQFPLPTKSVELINCEVVPSVSCEGPSSLDANIVVVTTREDLIDNSNVMESPVILDDKLVVAWLAPSVPCSTIPHAALGNSQINGDGLVIVGQGPTEIAITACREWLGGVEVSQYALVTTDGKVNGLVSASDGIRRVTATGPARYVRRGLTPSETVYVLLEGSPSPDLPVVEHPWRAPSMAVVQSGASHLGVEIVANGIVYRLPNHRIANLYHDGKCARLRCGTPVIVQNVPPNYPVGVMSVRMLGREFRYVTLQMEGQPVSTYSYMVGIQSSATAMDLMLIVQDVPPSLISPTMHFVPAPTPQLHVLALQARRNLGPYQWTQVWSPELVMTGATTVTQLSRQLYHAYGSVSPRRMQAESQMRFLQIRELSFIPTRMRESEDSRVWYVYDRAKRQPSILSLVPLAGLYQIIVMRSTSFPARLARTVLSITPSVRQRLLIIYRSEWTLSPRRLRASGDLMCRVTASSLQF